MGVQKPGNFGNLLCPISRKPRLLKPIKLTEIKKPNIWTFRSLEVLCKAFYHSLYAVQFKLV